MTDCRFRDCRELDVCLERLGQTKITDYNLGTDSHDCESAFAWWFLSAKLVWYHFVPHIDGLRKKPWWLCRHFGLASSHLLQPHQAMPCALCLCDSLEPAPTKGFRCSSCTFTCHLCVPGQFSSNCTWAFAGLKREFRQHWCWFMHVPVVWVLIILSIQLSCNHAARCQLPEWKVVSQMFGSQTCLFSRFERKREKYEAMINGDKSNYVEQILL